jgi:hypothetical protein
MHRKDRIQTNNAYLNSFLVHRVVMYNHGDRLGLRSMDIDVLIAVEKITRGFSVGCTVMDLKEFLTGNARYSAYEIVSLLLEKGLLLNSGKIGKRCKRIISLSDTGQEAVRAIYSSITERISYLNDKLKLRALKEAEKRAKK